MLPSTDDRFPTEGVLPLSPDSTVPRSNVNARLEIRAVRAVAALVALVAIVDQLTKSLIVGWLGPDASRHRHELLGNVFAFDYVENTGAAFGILSGRVWLLIVLAFAVGGWFLIAYRRHLVDSVSLQRAVGLVVGGAAGNLVDRVRLGHVVDFVAVGIWPRFNVADASITLGLVLLFFAMMRGDVGEDADP